MTRKWRWRAAATRRREAKRLGAELQLREPATRQPSGSRLWVKLRHQASRPPRRNLLRLRTPARPIAGMWRVVAPVGRCRITPATALRQKAAAPAGDRGFRDGP